MADYSSFGLQDKVAIVTGASQGIGRAIALGLATAGAHVVLAKHPEGRHDEIKGVQAEIEALGRKAPIILVDVANVAQVQSLMEQTKEQFGRIDILVNNAATNPVMGRTVDADLDAWDKTFRVNVRGPLVWTQLVWRASMEANGGCVINISSVGGIAGGAGIGAYNVTKAALIHLTKVHAIELAPKVRVNAIAPGLVKTDFARALWEPAGDEGARALPLRRFGEPDDIAGSAVYLASDAARWITGHVLVVDGGALVARSPV
jgi:NAD(P)-dependent dehydrogenase (short-subunit alcohol dehydrogenase family)